MLLHQGIYWDDCRWFRLTCLLGCSSGTETGTGTGTGLGFPGRAIKCCCRSAPKAGLLGSAMGVVVGGSDLMGASVTGCFRTWLGIEIGLLGSADCGITGNDLGSLLLVGVAPMGLLGRAEVGIFGIEARSLTGNATGWDGIAGSNLNWAGLGVVAPGLRLSISSICSREKSNGVWNAEKASMPVCCTFGASGLLLEASGCLGMPVRGFSAKALTGNCNKQK